VVDSSDSNFVTFRATVDASFAPGTQITGFGLSSSAPSGTVAWGLQSSNEAIGSQGTVTGPALPPDVIIVTGPSSDSLVVGGEGAITVTVQAVANELPEIPVTFTSTGGVTFNNGNVSPHGASTTILTATNGQQWHR